MPPKNSSGGVPQSFDFVVIGGGSAGYTAAAEAVKHGLRTALIEGAAELGGLCILRGCMPSKTLIASANRFRAVSQAAELGVAVNPPRLQPRAVIARKRRLVEVFARARREELAHGGFEVIRGQARFLDAHRVSVTPPNGGPEIQVRASTALIATGSYIPKPKFPGLIEAGYLTSDDILEDKSPPASVIILGDGPVGLEAAHYYSAIGRQVILISKHARILDSADPDISESLARALKNAGVKIISHAEVESAGKTGASKAVKLRVKGRSKTVRAKEIVFAIGRKPRTDGLGLEQIGVDLTDSRHIDANEQQRTSKPHIFAAGDVCGPYEILHLAVHQGGVGSPQRRPASKETEKWDRDHGLPDEAVRRIYSSGSGDSWPDRNEGAGR